MGSEQSSQQERLQEGEINVVITGAHDPDDVEVEVLGEIRKVVTDEDLRSFGLVGGCIQEAFSALDHGSTHNNFYFRGPTPPNGNIYEENNWKEVKKVMRPDSWEVLESTTEPIAISVDRFVNRNRCGRTGSYGTEIGHTETNTIATTWHNTKAVHGGLTIKYKLLQKSGTAAVDYTSTSGKDDFQSKSLQISSRRHVNVDLEPGDEMDAVIRVTRHYIKLKVYYKVTLTGTVIGHIDHFMQGYTNVPRGVNKVLDEAELDREICCSEVITVNYYTRGDIGLY